MIGEAKAKWDSSMDLIPEAWKAEVLKAESGGRLGRVVMHCGHLHVEHIVFRDGFWVVNKLILLSPKARPI